MKKVKEFAAALPKEITITKLDFVLGVLIGALAGIVVGMLVSPRKNISVHCGNDNGNHYFGEDDGVECLKED